MLVLVPEAMLTGGALEHRYHRISMLLAGSHLYMFTRFLQEKNTRNQRERERERERNKSNYSHAVSSLPEFLFYKKNLSFNPLLFNRRHST